MIDFTDNTATITERIEHATPADARAFVERSLRIVQIGAELHELHEQAFATNNAAARSEIVRRCIVIATEAHDLAHDMPTLRASYGDTLVALVGALRRLDGIETA